MHGNIRAIEQGRGCGMWSGCVVLVPRDKSFDREIRALVLEFGKKIPPTIQLLEE